MNVFGDPFKKGYMPIQCKVCGTTFDIECYGDAQCPKCSRKYVYTEDHALKLTDCDLQVLRDFDAGRLVDPEKIKK